jgi:hypothetical protein
MDLREGKATFQIKPFVPWKIQIFQNGCIGIYHQAFQMIPLKSVFLKLFYEFPHTGKYKQKNVQELISVIQETLGGG